MCSMAVLLFGACYLILWRILRPIAAIKIGTEQVGAGNLAFRLRLQEDNEIGVLSNKFDRMADNIAQAQARISGAIEDLRASEKFSNAIFETIPNALLLIDSSGAVARANQAALDNFGYTREQIKTVLIDTIMPNCMAKVGIFLSDGSKTSLSKQTTASENEMTGLHADGHTFPVDLALSLLAYESERFVIVSVTDLTQRRETEGSLARYAAIVESTDVAIISKTLQGVITSWNKGAEQMFGYPREEVLGKSIALLIPKQLLFEEEEILSRIRNGEWMKGYETVRRCKNGQLIDISDRKSTRLNS